MQGESCGRDDDGLLHQPELHLPVNNIENNQHQYWGQIIHHTSYNANYLAPGAMQ